MQSNYLKTTVKKAALAIASPPPLGESLFCTIGQLVGAAHDFDSSRWAGRFHVGLVLQFCHRSS